MRLARFVLIASAALCVPACDRSSPSPSPSPSPSISPMTSSSETTGAAPAPPVAARSAAGASRTPLERIVNMLDACEPETFNAALGPGTCVRQGGMRFALFIDQLTKHGFVGAWQFAPKTTGIHRGDTLVAVNKGGEVHTFTEVDAFGGGIVPDLNALAGTPTVAPECAALEEDDFVAPGGRDREAVNEGGTTKFQCCIHPWMRLEAQVSAK